MSSIVVSGDTSGAITLQAPAVSGTNTLTLPASTDTLVGKATTDTLTNKTLTSPTISGAVISAMGSSVITSGTAVASTSGTSIDFTGIPSWAKRVTVMFNAISTNGSSPIQIQLGSGSVEVTGYASTGGYFGSTNQAAGSTSTTGLLTMTTTGAAVISSGLTTISTLGSNIWVSSTTQGRTDGYMFMGAGVKTTAGVIDRVRITTVNGTDTFDAGSINILYE